MSGIYITLHILQQIFLLEFLSGHIYPVLYQNKRGLILQKHIIKLLEKACFFSVFYYVAKLPNLLKNNFRAKYA